jgi:glycosyltransferase involved in cell wall biosynthesis
MKVSVAISTYQRASRLPRLVAALEAQTIPRDDFEVIIADNGTTDETADVLAGLAARTGLHLKVVRVPRNRGPAGGRNAAWRAARAPIVAFTDDDCMPAPVWLEAGLVAMEGGRRIVAGRTVPDPEQDGQRGPFSLSVAVEEVRYFNTCNIFYRRADLESAGGFDETFTTPGGEDTDLGLRVKAMGAETAFAADSLVYHEVTRSSFGGVLRQTLRWSDIPLFIRKHPGAREWLLYYGGLFWRPSHPRVILAALGAIVAVAGLTATPYATLGLVLAAPWLWFRIRRRPLAAGPRRRLLVLPGAFVIDLLEVLVMVKGSVRHRTLVL